MKECRQRKIHHLVSGLQYLLISMAACFWLLIPILISVSCYNLTTCYPILVAISHVLPCDIYWKSALVQLLDCPSETPSHHFVRLIICFSQPLLRVFLWRCLFGVDPIYWGYGCSHLRWKQSRSLGGCCVFACGFLFLTFSVWEHRKISLTSLAVTVVCGNNCWCARGIFCNGRHGQRWWSG